MNKINQRIKLVRSELHLSQHEFSKKIFLGQSSLGEIETGTRNVNDRIIQLICSQFNVNKDWIKTGRGQMFDVEKPDVKLEHLIDIYKQLEEPLQKYLLEQSEGLLKLHNENTIIEK